MNLEPLEKSLEHRFLHPELLVRALTHSSASHQSRGSTYERLEFLGDRVLGLIVARMLYDRFPHESEGDLSKRHSALVCRDALVRVAKTLRIAPFVILSAGEEAAGGRENPAILADVCEALIAAVYLDGG
ncbi:MAG TPA: ribonuclease III, partial [Rhodospirillales bacterium]|nr:ribonuclease III [Rhodospirillales bacterium]